MMGHGYNGDHQYMGIPHQHGQVFETSPPPTGKKNGNNKDRQGMRKRETAGIVTIGFLVIVVIVLIVVLVSNYQESEVDRKKQQKEKSAAASEKANVVEENEEQTNKLKAAEDNVKKLQAEIKERGDEITGLKSDLETAKKTAATEKQKLKEENSTSKKEMTDLRTKFAELETERNNLKNEVAGLKKELTSKRKEVEDLTAAAQSLSLQISQGGGGASMRPARPPGANNVPQPGGATDAEALGTEFEETKDLNKIKELIKALLGEDAARVLESGDGYQKILEKTGNAQTKARLQFAKNFALDKLLDEAETPEDLLTKARDLGVIRRAVEQRLIEENTANSLTPDDFKEIKKGEKLQGIMSLLEKKAKAAKNEQPAQEPQGPEAIFKNFLEAEEATRQKSWDDLIKSMWMMEGLVKDGDFTVPASAAQSRQVFLANSMAEIFKRFQDEFFKKEDAANRTEALARLVAFSVCEELPLEKDAANAMVAEANLKLGPSDLQTPESEAAKKALVGELIAKVLHPEPAGQDRPPEQMME